MNSRAETLSHDPYMDHPLAPVFIEAAFVQHETNGDTAISLEKRSELAGTFGLDQYEVSAHAYLARRRVEQALASFGISH